MPRPTRIEYENAFYHVMNRGRAHNNIFFKDLHYQTFLKILEESCSRFEVVIHSYCLMPNHYHILLQTQNANLSRLMGYLNSIYTKRFNKFQKIDGPLFRGRYKAILVDSDDYLLELSKYIHKNPIRTKDKQNRLVTELKDYKYSSYQSYLDISKTPEWLNKELILSKFNGNEDLLKRYQLFVETEDENKQLETFFNKKNQEMIMGLREFKEKILIEQFVDNKTKRDLIRKEINNEITINQILKVTAKVFNVTTESITNKQEGKPKKNNPKSLAMYLVQEIKDCPLKEIANIFSLKDSRSSGFSLVRIRREIKSGLHKDQLNKIKSELGVINT